MDVQVGSWVRIKADAWMPVPTVVKKHPQRVREVQGETLVLERWIARFRSWVALKDVKISDVELIPAEKAPVNSCLIFGFNIRDSGVDAENRGHCSYCRLKDKCEYWQSRHPEEK